MFWPGGPAGVITVSDKLKKVARENVTQPSKVRTIHNGITVPKLIEASRNKKTPAGGKDYPQRFELD